MPVEVDGVGVLTGDWVYADAAGVVVLPAGDVETVRAEERRSGERDAAAATAARLRLP